MSFIDWLTSKYPAESKVQPYGVLHILTLIACIGAIVAIALLSKKMSSKAKRLVLWVLVGLILFFEIARRIVNLCKTTDFSLHNIMVTLLPRPWCAISCWVLIISAIINKKFAYNFASISALLCAVIFFAYPGVGFRAPYFLFEDLYSVATHSLLLITSVSLITLGFTNFDFKQFWKVAVCYAVILVYSLLEIFVLKIEGDPMYFMPNSDVQSVLGMDYGLFLAIYITFTIIYFCAFPFVHWLKQKSTAKKLAKPQN